MKVALRSVRLVSAAVISVLIFSPMLNSSLAAAPSPGAARDGSHDFDWEIGAWNTRLRTLRHRPDGSSEWVSFEGTTVVRPIWNCRANMVELTAKGPDGPIVALNLRLYDPQSHQWSLNFANARGGGMAVPTVGEFRDGIGEFYDQEALNGRTVWVRNIWSRITHDTGHLEQAISDDGGRTWTPNWIADDTRVAGSTDPCQPSK